MNALLDAVETFFGELAAVGWAWIAAAAGCHLAKILARSRAWRNVLAAAYPEADVRWRSVFGAYAAAVGVNAVLPARGGDLLRLYLVKRRVPGATYPTLGSSLLVETLFDTTVAVSLLAWALTLGVLPGRDVIPSLPAIDWLWVFQHPRAALAVTLVLAVLGFVLVAFASRHVAAFWERVKQGLTVLRTPRRYLRRVVPWQALDWTLRIATLYFLLRAFDVPANLHNALLVQVTQSLSGILPLTPAGIGTEQALLVYVFRGDVATTTLLSFSVGMKLVIIAVNVVLGFAAIAVMLRTLRWRRVLEGEQEAPEAAR